MGLQFKTSTGLDYVTSGNPLPVTFSTGAITVPATGTGGTSYGGIAPIILYAKAITVLTAATPADIATITIPAGITRFRLSGGGGTNNPAYSGVAETAAGTLAGANFNLHDTAAGGGNRIGNTMAGPANTTTATGGIADNNALVTTGTIYIRQTASSANAGTLSVYVTIYPLP